jgi:glutaconate CoA-transferase subunit B
VVSKMETLIDYSPVELMIVLAAREIKNEEVVFAGTGFPVCASILAKNLHAPNISIIFEAGTIDSRMLHMPMSVGDPRTVRQSCILTGLFSVFSYLQAGYVDVGFLSGAQVDKYGNINATCIGDYQCPEVRFTGSGGSCDIGSLAKRTIIIATHERRRFPEKVSYITTPGWLDGGKSREESGLKRGGPSAIITDKAVMRFESETKSPYLKSYHPGTSPQHIKQETGYDIDISNAVETTKPTKEEIRILREIVDPERIFIR